jgi:hypothetical protein
MFTTKHKKALEAIDWEISRYENFIGADEIHKKQLDEQVNRDKCDERIAINRHKLEALKEFKQELMKL